MDNVVINSSIAKNNGRLFFVDNIRCFAIAAVVAIHLFSYLSNQLIGLHTFISFLSMYAVPIFFLCDGYLFSASQLKNKNPKPERYFQKNFYRLFIPWLFFSALYLFLRYLVEFFGVVPGKYVLGNSVKNILIDTYASVHSGQMYFLLSLLMIRSAALIILSKNTLLNSGIALTASFFVYLLFFPALNELLYIKNGNEPLLAAIWGMQFYFLGSFLFLLMKEIKATHLLTLTLVANLILWGFQIAPSALLSVPLLFILFFLMLNRQIPFISHFGKRTMGIYLIHMPIVINLITIILKKFHLPAMVLLLVGVLMAMIVSNFIYEVAIKLAVGKFIFGETPVDKQSNEQPLTNTGNKRR